MQTDLPPLSQKVLDLTEELNNFLTRHYSTMIHNPKFHTNILRNELRMFIAKMILEAVYGIHRSDLFAPSEVNLGHFICKIDSPTRLREVLLQYAQHNSKNFYYRPLDTSLLEDYVNIVQKISKQRMVELYCILMGVNQEELEEGLDQDVLQHIKNNYKNLSSQSRYNIVL